MSSDPPFWTWLREWSGWRYPEGCVCRVIDGTYLREGDDYKPFLVETHYGQDEPCPVHREFHAENKRRERRLMVAAVAFIFVGLAAVVMQEITGSRWWLLPLLVWVVPLRIPRRFSIQSVRLPDDVWKDENARRR